MMQGYTHLILGTAIGFHFFPHNAPAQIACIAGSEIPDALTLSKFILDKMKGKIPFYYESPFFLFGKNSSHSLIFWSVISIIGLICSSGRFGLLTSIIGICALGHVLIDIPTHADEKYKKTDCSYLWPFKSGILRDKLGIWEYRTGSFIPKPFELAVNIILALIILNQLAR